MKLDIKSLLQITLEKNASDLHLLNNSQPMLRVDGVLMPVPGSPVLNKESLKVLILALMTTTQREFYIQNKELDFSVSLGDKARFRVNAYTQRGTMAVALRLIPQSIRTIEQLNLPEVCHAFANLNAGLILVTGPTGHGKSTTLAAMVNEINNNRSEHIITIEDPIEYVYENKKSIISQREVHHDTLAWKVALRSTLREDPDVVLIGEMRDFETIAAVLTIAETGHLVFTTLHTNSAAQSIDRIVDVFPAHQQNQIRMQLANTIEAVISQRLLPGINGGRIPAVEILKGSSAVKTNIREGKSHLINNIMQTSREEGMITMDSYLAELVSQDKITIDEARKWSLRPGDLTHKTKTLNAKK
jgi:twitching motility protein PilT